MRAKPSCNTCANKSPGCFYSRDITSKTGECIGYAKKEKRIMRAKKVKQPKPATEVFQGRIECNTMDKIREIAMAQDRPTVQVIRMILKSAVEKNKNN